MLVVNILNVAQEIKCAVKLKNYDSCHSTTGLLLLAIKLDQLVPVKLD